jgi:hypothetical protein
MKLIQYQANVLWDNIFSKDTIQTYKQALVKTWNLLKETAILLLMLFLLIVVFVVWVWHIGFNSGREFRKWMVSPNQAPEKMFGDIIEWLKELFIKVFTEVKQFVEKKIGLELPALNPGSEKKKIDSNKDNP